MSFVAVFFFLVLALAVGELYLLVHAAAAIGFLATLGLCVLTGVAGGAVVRHQGLQTLARLQRELAGGRLPAGAILEGIVLLVTGALLCVPGFITDAAGALLLVPPLRRVFVGRLRRWIAARFTIVPGPRAPEIVDVEVEHVEDHPA